MKVLVAVDGSVYTKRMVAYIAAHDEWLGDRHEYTLLHTVQPAPHGVSAMLGRAALKPFYDEAAAKVFKPLRTFFDRRGMRASFVAKIGAPSDCIAETARKGGYDLLMMGSRGHGSLGGLVLGSVANRVLASCTTPILLIR
jgi:nucleotide-binding universal stress UspA family protein